MPVKKLAEIACVSKLLQILPNSEEKPLAFCAVHIIFTLAFKKNEFAVAKHRTHRGKAAFQLSGAENICKNKPPLLRKKRKLLVVFVIILCPKNYRLCFYLHCSISRRW